MFLFDKYVMFDSYVISDNLIVDSDKNYKLEW